MELARYIFFWPGYLAIWSPSWIPAGDGTLRDSERIAHWQRNQHSFAPFFSIPTYLIVIFMFMGPGQARKIPSQSAAESPNIAAIAPAPSSQATPPAQADPTKDRPVQTSPNEADTLRDAPAAESATEQPNTRSAGVAGEVIENGSAKPACPAAAGEWSREDWQKLNLKQLANCYDGYIANLRATGRMNIGVYSENQKTLRLFDDCNADIICQRTLLIDAIGNLK